MAEPSAIPVPPAMQETILNTATRTDLDAAKTQVALANVNAQGLAGESGSKQMQDDIQGGLKMQLSQLERQQATSGRQNRVSRDRAIAELTVPEPVRGVARTMESINPDAAKTFLALNAFERETNGRDETKPEHRITQQLAALLAFQINDGIIQNPGDSRVLSAVGDLIGNEGKKQAEQFAGDFRRGAAPQKLQAEGGSIAVQALVAAQKAIDAGTGSGQAQLGDPPAPADLPAIAGASKSRTRG